jgi:hypothetical protein
MKQSQKQTAQKSGLLKIVLLFGALLGVCVGFLEKASTPAERPVDLRSEALSRAYIAGRSGGWTAWRSMETNWLDGRVERIEFSEAELNQWSDTRLILPLPSRGSGIYSAAWGPPNIRLMEDSIQFAVRVRFPWLFPNRTFLVQMRGALRFTEDGPVFRPVQAFWGQLPLLFPVKNLLWRHMQKVYGEIRGMDVIKKRFGEVQSIELHEGSIEIVG